MEYLVRIGITLLGNVNLNEDGKMSLSMISSLFLELLLSHLNSEGAPPGIAVLLRGIEHKSLSSAGTFHVHRNRTILNDTPTATPPSQEVCLTRYTPAIEYSDSRHEVRFVFSSIRQ